jgi:very-short-patch-repair endonuclease
MKKEGLITTGHHIPYNPKLKERARELRKEMTESEKKLWNGFLKKQSFKVLRQKPLNNYIVDFYCPKLKLVIEVDGDSHNANDSKEYDGLRTRVLKGYGLRVIRFYNYSVMTEFNDVCRQIESVVKSPLAPL